MWWVFMPWFNAVYDSSSSQYEYHSLLHLIARYGVQVKAFVSRKLWCFPERSETIIIPRFKIVDCTFSLWPKFMFFDLLALLSIFLIMFGHWRGGCNKTTATTAYAYGGNPYSSPSYYNPTTTTTTSYNNSGACASLAIGCIMLVLCVIAFLLVLFFVKKWVVLTLCDGISFVSNPHRPQT